MKLEFYHEEDGIEEEYTVHVEPYEGMRSRSWYEPDEPAGFDFIKAVNSETGEVLDEDSFYEKFPDAQEELEEMIADQVESDYLEAADRAYDIMMDR